MQAIIFLDSNNTISLKMSLRALKRLDKTKLEDELAKFQKQQDNIDKEFEEADEEMFNVSSSTNAFALLNEETDDEESEKDDGEEKNGRNLETEEEPVVKIIPRSTVKKNNRKSPRKVDDLDNDELDKILANIKSRDRKLEQNVDGFEDDDEEDDDDNDEIEGPWPMYVPGGKLLTVKRFAKCSHLLELDARDLDPDREYENLFGKLSNAAIDDADSTSSSFITPEVLKQIKKLSKRVRGWSGRDRRSIPGTSRKLMLTKIRDDWMPIAKKPLAMEEMTQADLLALFGSKFKNDWKEIIRSDITKDIKSGIKYYLVNSGPMYSTAATTEFFISVVVQPDHESLIQLLQRSPYHMETILQVASILQRQGDNSNTNGLIERALFIFDWSLTNSFELGNGKSRLPFEYFLNRQIYLTLFRYITVLTQKSTFYTAWNYCKLLLSFDPTDDPYGVRYFIDFYSFMAGEYEYLIELLKSPLCECYEEWITPSLMYTVGLCYWKLNKFDLAKEALKNAYDKHPYTAHEILNKLGDPTHPWLLDDVSPTVELNTSIYTIRIIALTEEQGLKNFLVRELSKIIETVGKPDINRCYFNNLEKIPNNLIRHVILSNESSAMAKIPESFWNENEIYEFDVLPPKLGTTIYNYLDSDKIANNMVQQTMEAEEIRQIEDLMRQSVIEH